MAEYKSDRDVVYCLAEYYDEFARIPMELLNMIDSLQAIDIIRCSECKHYQSDGGAEMICSVTNLNVDDDDYCSYGERKGK